MQHPDDYLTHTHDGRVANAYSSSLESGRKLNALATDSATISDSSSSLINIGIEVYSIEGNMPTGQPTSVPSTTAPTNYKFKVIHEGWATGNEDDRSTLSMASVAVLYMVGFILFFAAEYKVAHSLKESYNVKEKLMNKIESGKKVAPEPTDAKVSNGSTTPIQKLTPPPSMPVIHESEELSTMEKEELSKQNMELRLTRR